MDNSILKAYRDAWKKCMRKFWMRKQVGGKEVLKKRMDKLLIECVEANLG